VYALSMAQDVATLEAVSQNLMHANLSVTDGVYGILSDVDVRRQIARLRRHAELRSEGEVKELVSVTKRLLKRLEESG
jgi:hypothetical protein